MIGQQNKQMEMTIVDLISMVPKDHLLMKIHAVVDFDFIYVKATADLYSKNGRPSVDPVLLVKMLLVDTCMASSRSGDWSRRFRSILRIYGFVDLG